ncbi:MAG: chemotaxis protein CheD [Myxococcales bacterium]|jgi:chemotaxis protein CheD|nr:chemotaxis protein CheD [Myxococcales bacterium]
MTLEGNVIVGIAESAVVRVPLVLETKALGSCLGVAIYDCVAHSAGLLHAMLPERSAARSSARHKNSKFVDSGIRELVDGILKIGGKRLNLRAKIAGGANMFPSIQSSAPGIGARNYETALAVLDDLGIPLVASDVGGNYGRSVLFFTKTLQMLIKSINAADKTT